MKLLISPKAEKELRKIPKIDQIIIARKIRSLSNPSAILNSEKLSGYPNIYRIRVGNYRIVFRKTTAEIYVILIGHRRDIYRLINQLLR